MKTFVFQQVRHREQRGAGGSIHFWRDRTREVDFVIDRGGRLELIESKFTELPTGSDAVNLRFVREVVGAKRVGRCLVACRTPNPFPLTDGVEVESPADWAPAI